MTRGLQARSLLKVLMEVGEIGDLRQTLISLDPVDRVAWPLASYPNLRHRVQFIQICT
jgi:hypothetical protein